MRSKGAIKFFAIALALVSLFQLSFTFVSWLQEEKAEEFADGNPVLYRQYLDSIAHQPVYDLLVKDYTYMEVKERSLNLGLDLQGGMHVTLEVSLANLVRGLANNPSDEGFNEALALAEERAEVSQAPFLELFYEAYQELNPDQRLATFFATLENKEYLTYNSTDEEVMAFLREQSEDALTTTFNILRTRIDRFGVTQPNIQMQENTGRIVVELPGADDPERIRRILQNTAELAFWETYQNPEFQQYLFALNDALADVAEAEGDTTTEGEGAEEFFGEEDAEADDADAGEFFDEADEIPQPEEEVLTDPEAEEDDLLAGLEGDTAGADTAAQLSPEEMRRQNPLFALLYPNVNQTDQGTRPVEGPTIAYAAGKDTAKVIDLLTGELAAGIIPAGTRFFWSAEPLPESENTYFLIAARGAGIGGEPQLDGRVVTDATATTDQYGAWEVMMRMNAEGAQAWQRLTANNIGQSVAIVLDNKVYSAPTVQSEISGGVSTISGNFTATEAGDLENILKSGRLPISVDIIEEAVVGPSLGRASINQGLTSLVIGLLLVLVFMGIYYHVSGLVANFALIANMFFIIGVLASLGAALTLPGMAGIVLTIGMSVDANVIIFERIREELRAGKGMKLAIADGYRAAYSAIIDGNLTTLLTGIILLTFGSGPISGFATVLVIGILTSFFSAVFITRLVFNWMAEGEKDIRFGFDFSKNVLQNPKVNFLKGRKTAYLVSSVLIVAGIISLFTTGLDLGVDFKGGWSYRVAFEEPAQTEDIRAALADHLGAAPEVKTFGGNDEYKITTDYLIDESSETAAAQVREALEAGLAELGNPYEVLSLTKVGPTIASDIRTSAFWAVGFSLLVVFLYIFIRFRKWQFGLGAVVALFHDVLLIIGIFSLLKNVVPWSMEIDQAFIAAILTVVGYSINDTVIVFDRVRENLALHTRTPYKANINNALNDTLSRTLITSGTTFLVVLILFLFGGDIIRGFSFALLIGIIVGTYSSLYIATPIVVDLANEDLQERKPVEQPTPVTNQA